MLGECRTLYYDQFSHFHSHVVSYISCNARFPSYVQMFTVFTYEGQNLKKLPKL